MYYAGWIADTVVIMITNQEGYHMNSVYTLTWIENGMLHSISTGMPCALEAMELFARNSGLTYYSIVEEE